MNIVLRGHKMEIVTFYGQDGEMEDLFLWCHSCDPKGKGIENGTVDLSDGIDLTAARKEVERIAEIHSWKTLA